MSQTDDQQSAPSSPSSTDQESANAQEPVSALQELYEEDKSFELLWAQWEEADVRVSAKDGRKLWCVHMDGDGIMRVVFEDRKALLRASDSTYDLLEYDLDGSSESAGHVTSLNLDARTGNVFYQSIDGGVTTVWLNNGSCLERILTAGDEDVYFITDAGGLLRSRAYNVKFNSASDTLTYESEDGSQLVVILCHRTAE